MCNARVGDTHDRANTLDIPHKRIRGQILFYITSRARRLHDCEFVGGRVSYDNLGADIVRRLASDEASVAFTYSSSEEKAR
jgi:hypothetical protein